MWHVGRLPQQGSQGRREVCIKRATLHSDCVESRWGLAIGCDYAFRIDECRIDDIPIFSIFGDMSHLHRPPPSPSSATHVLVHGESHVPVCIAEEPCRACGFFGFPELERDKTVRRAWGSRMMTRTTGRSPPTFSPQGAIALQLCVLTPAPRANRGDECGRGG